MRSVALRGVDMRYSTKKIISLLWLPLMMALTQCRQDETFYVNTFRADVFYQEYEDRQYDFLWVFDNSESMRPRREFVVDNLQGFLSILNSRKAIDYQMAMVTTDFFNDNGALVKDTSNRDVVKSASSSNPVGDLAGIINNIQDSSTSFWEQGLESAYQAIYQHGADFSRVGVPLIVVFLTDENDFSCKDDCFGPEPENNTTYQRWEMDRYINYFRQAKASQNVDLAVFNIVGMNLTDCALASVGTRYIQLQEAIGGYGASGSVCNSQLKDSYENIARQIANRGSVFTLSKKTSGLGLAVYVNQVLVPFSTDNYVFDTELNAIIFTGAAPKTGSIIEVTYSELND